MPEWPGAGDFPAMNAQRDALREAKKHAEALLLRTTDPQTRIAIQAIIAEIEKALSFPPDPSTLN